MGSWQIELDNDWKRLGFDPRELESEHDVTVSASERLSATATLVVVVTYLGGKLLDKATDKALSRSLDKLLDFARSRERRLKLELKENRFDDRVQALFAKIESMAADEFEQALRALPALRGRAYGLLSARPDYYRDLWYEWDNGDWHFRYALTEGGEIVESEPALAALR